MYIDDDYNKVKFIIVLAFIACAICLLFSGCTGCQSAPNRENYTSELAYMLADCNYRNQTNPLACVELAKRYNARDLNMEQREILDFCKKKENYPEGWDNEKCRMFLKQRD